MIRIECKCSWKIRDLEIEVTRARKEERKHRNGSMIWGIIVEEGNLFPSGSEVVTLGNGSGIWMGLRWTSASHFLLSVTASLCFFLPYITTYTPPVWATAPNAAFCFSDYHNNWCALQGLSSYYNFNLTN